MTACRCPPIRGASWCCRPTDRADRDRQFRQGSRSRGLQRVPARGNLIRRSFRLSESATAMTNDNRQESSDSAESFAIVRRSECSGERTTGDIRPGRAITALAPSCPAPDSTGCTRNRSGAGKAATVVSGVDLRAQDIAPAICLPRCRAHARTARSSPVDAWPGCCRDLDRRRTGCACSRAHPTRRPAPVPVLVIPKPGRYSARSRLRSTADPSVAGCRSSASPGRRARRPPSYLLEAALPRPGTQPGWSAPSRPGSHGRPVRSALTTPEAPHLQALFAVMVEQGVDTVVMEVSCHALSLGRVDGTTFDVGAFTNLSQDHLDFHQDLEEYFAGESPSVRSGSRSRPHGRDLHRRRVGPPDGRGAATAAPRSPCRPRQPRPRPDWVGTESRSLADGRQRLRPSAGRTGVVARLSLLCPAGSTWPTPRGPGRSVEAAGRDVELGGREPLAEVVVPGRMERVDPGQDFMAVVDYAHKPAALDGRARHAARSAFRRGSAIVVVGAGGDRDAGKRPVMGEAGAAVADLLIVTDDNPRSKYPAAIRAAVLAGRSRSPDAGRGGIARGRETGGRDRTAVRWARPGDAVMVAGKGHEQGQEIDGDKHPFDDREVLAETATRTGTRACRAQRTEARHDPDDALARSPRSSEDPARRRRSVGMVTGTAEFDSRRVTSGCAVRGAARRPRRRS